MPYFTLAVLLWTGISQDIVTWIGLFSPHRNIKNNLSYLSLGLFSPRRNIARTNFLTKKEYFHIFKSIIIIIIHAWKVSPDKCKLIFSMFPVAHPSQPLSLFFIHLNQCFGKKIICQSCILGINCAMIEYNLDNTTIGLTLPLAYHLQQLIWFVSVFRPTIMASMIGFLDRAIRRFLTSNFHDSRRLDFEFYF